MSIGKLVKKRREAYNAEMKRDRAKMKAKMAEPMRTVWDDNSIQFPRLLAEIKMVGLTPGQMKGLCASMDLSKEEINTLLDRAEEAFENIKTN